MNVLKASKMWARGVAKRNVPCLRTSTLPLSVSLSSRGLTTKPRRTSTAAAPIEFALNMNSDAHIPEAVLNMDMVHEKHWDNERIPKYLNDTYWWAYIHPNAVRFFERQWLINLILWGNYDQLRDAALVELDTVGGHRNMIQISCAYGSLTHTLVYKHMRANDELTVLDIAPVQLRNTARKLRNAAQGYGRGSLATRNVKMHQCDCRDLSEVGATDASMDCVLLFFLLHEVPNDVKVQTLREALRVLKAGSTHKLVIVDYHKPHQWYNPFLYLMHPVLTYLEPFAMDIWKTPVEDWLQEAHVANGDEDNSELRISKENHYFGGLYQKLVISKIPK